MKTPPLALLDYLDALAAWNAFLGHREREPEPEGTRGITVDGAAAERLSGQLGVPLLLVRACLVGVPVKQARAARDWILSHESEEDYDPALLLFRYANKHVAYVSALKFEEITGRRVA